MTYFTGLIDKLEVALQSHHGWHLNLTDRCLVAGPVMVSPAEEYSESKMCDDTGQALTLLAQLREAVPDGLGDALKKVTQPLRKSEIDNTALQTVYEAAALLHQITEKK